jgi:hypothetical protein
LAVGLLFGNVNVLFPLLYGLVLVAALSPATRDKVGGGVGLALAGITKLHPASLGLWFLVRGVRERRAGERPASWIVIGAAVGVALTVLLVSVLAGGAPLWSDYVSVVRTGAQASIIDPRNAGPAATLAAALGQGESVARLLQVPVVLLAVAVTAWAAWTRDDALEGIAWGAAASLATLPVTWYHYAAALIPFAIAALLRAAGTPRLRETLILVGAAWLVSAVAILWIPLGWVAVVLVIAAIRRSVTGTVELPMTARLAA